MTTLTKTQRLEHAEHSIRVIERINRLQSAAITRVGKQTGVLLQSIEAAEVRIKDAEERLDGAAGRGVERQPTHEISFAGAARRQEVVGFKYRDAAGELSYRVFSPWEVEYGEAHPVTPHISVLGWDHGREGIRRFRIARLLSRPVLVPSERYREPEPSDEG